MNDVITYYPNGYYEVKQKGELHNTRQYYFVGSSRIALRENGTLQYLLTDHLGSTMGLIDTDGDLISSSQYTAFGELRIGGSSSPDYRYTGQREELELGLYFYRARWYGPALSRFVQADTFVSQPGSSQAYDRYSYVNDNPINFNDPSGHRACDDYSGRGCNVLKPKVVPVTQPAVTYVKGYNQGQLENAHQFQDGTPYCGPFSLAIVQTLLTGEKESGNEINDFLVNNRLKYNNFGIPGKSLSAGANLLLQDYDAKYQSNGTIDELKKNVDEGIITMVGVSWQTTIQIINDLIDDDRKTNPTVGHWMVVAGYNDSTKEIILIDPGNDTSKPKEESPFTTWSYLKLEDHWLNTRNLFIGNGDMISIR